MYMSFNRLIGDGSSNGSSDDGDDMVVFGCPYGSYQQTTYAIIDKYNTSKFDSALEDDNGNDSSSICSNGPYYNQPISATEMVYLGVCVRFGASMLPSCC